MYEVIKMERDALVLYLRELRDLEIAKRKISILFNREKNFMNKK